MRKIIKIAIILLAVIFVGYHSIYFKKISDLKAENKKFDAESYARQLISNKLPKVVANAVDLDSLITEIKAKPEQAFAKYGKSLAIGGNSFFLVKAEGMVSNITESDVTLLTPQGTKISIITEYVFGNDIRDASGLISLSDFSNTTDLNNISSEINKIVRKEVVFPFRKRVTKGNSIKCSGAVALNIRHLNLDELEMQPTTLKIVK